MFLQCLEHTVLILLGNGRQGISKGRTNVATSQSALGLDREASGHLEAASDPSWLVAQELPHRANRQSIILDERLDHPGFIECGERSGRRVRQKQQTLVVDCVQGRFDDHGNVRVSGLAPLFEPLESINDFVMVVVCGDHPDREIGQLKRWSLQAAWAQWRIAGADLFDRKGERRTRDIRSGLDPRLTASTGGGGQHP